MLMTAEVSDGRIVGYVILIHEAPDSTRTDVFGNVYIRTDGSLITTLPGDQLDALDMIDQIIHMQIIGGKICNFQYNLSLYEDNFEVISNKLIEGVNEIARKLKLPKTEVEAFGEILYKMCRTLAKAENKEKIDDNGYSTILFQ